MAANTPTSASPALICHSFCARPVSMDAAPMPKKNSVIMPLRLQRSANHPAGMENTPKAMKPGSDSGNSSL